MRRLCRPDIYCSSNKGVKNTLLKGCLYQPPHILDIPFCKCASQRGNVFIPINHLFWCGNKMFGQSSVQVLETWEHKHFRVSLSVLIYMHMANGGNTSVHCTQQGHGWGTAVSVPIIGGVHACLDCTAYLWKVFEFLCHTKYNNLHNKSKHLLDTNEDKILQNVFNPHTHQLSLKLEKKIIVVTVRAKWNILIVWLAPKLFCKF